jgi:hypothetical protein
MTIWQVEASEAPQSWPDACPIRYSASEVRCQRHATSRTAGDDSRGIGLGQRNPPDGGGENRERGTSAHLDTIFKLAQGLDVPPAELFAAID